MYNYALYKGFTFKAKQEGEIVELSTNNKFIAFFVLKIYTIQKWECNFCIKVPLYEISKLYRIDKEYQIDGTFYPLFNENKNVYRVLVSNEIMTKNGLQSCLGPREPNVVEFKKSNGEIIKEIKTIFYPTKPTRSDNPI